MELSIRENSTNFNIKNLISNKYNIIKVLQSTVQGEIYLVENKKSKKFYVIKTSFRILYENHISKSGHNVNEDIIKEYCILKHLTLLSHNKTDTEKVCSNDINGFVKFRSFLIGTSHFYLIVEYGGIDLFEYNVKQQKNLKLNQNLTHEWHFVVSYIVAQLIQTVCYFHQTCHLCHLDLSLENILINEHNLQIKICDFGLALFFDVKNGNNNCHQFKCKQFGGKTLYKSPEMTNQQPFDARAADIWSIGVIIFTLFCGAPPFEIANEKDLRYQHIMDDKLDDLLSIWKLDHAIPDDAKDLLRAIFKPEKQRITDEQMLSHPYVIKCNVLKHNMDCERLLEQKPENLSSPLPVSTSPLSISVTPSPISVLQSPMSTSPSPI